MRMRIAIVLAVAALGLGAGAALASRPTAQLPDGTVVDLNTGVATAADGHHYKVSSAELAALRQQMAGDSAGQQAPAPATTVTAKKGPPPL